MKKLVLLGTGAIVAASVALIAPGVADSEPGSSAALNVVGEPYARAVSILKSMGVKPTFGGSVGSDLPQAACIVEQQKVTHSGKVTLLLNCTKAAADEATDNAPAGAGRGPTVGGNGITTVTPTPVGPQPGFNIPGA